MIEAHYTIDEAAKILHLKRSTLYNKISARQITVISGRPVLIPESAIKAYLRKKQKRALV